MSRPIPSIRLDRPPDPSLKSTPPSSPGPSSQAAEQPFNFAPVPYSPSKSNLQPTSRRKGHKYARSSVHHLAHLPTTPSPTPLQVPASLPLPTFSEFRKSMTTAQTLRLVWTFTHFTIAGLIFFRAHGTLSVAALAHLAGLDALGGLIRSAVDVARNFEVWSRSSVQMPFGLQRGEALARGAGSVVLLFMGIDLISHGLKDALSDSLGGGGHAHAHGDVHEHHEIGLGNAGVPALLGLLGTVVGAYVTNTRGESGGNLGSYLPGSLSIILLVIALSRANVPASLDIAISTIYALSMVVIGVVLSYRVGRMLLLSPPNLHTASSVANVVEELQRDPQVVSIEEAKVWQVHYRLCMASFRIKARSLEQTERLRERVASLVRMRLGGGYGDGDGSKGMKWEVSCQISLA